MPSASVDIENKLKDATTNKHRALCGWDVHMTISAKLVKQNNAKPKVLTVRKGKGYEPCLG